MFTLLAVFATTCFVFVGTWILASRGSVDEVFHWEIKNALKKKFIREKAKTDMLWSQVRHLKQKADKARDSAYSAGIRDAACAHVTEGTVIEATSDWYFHQPTEASTFVCRIIRKGFRGYMIKSDKGQLMIKWNVLVKKTDGIVQVTEIPVKPITPIIGEFMVVKQNNINQYKEISGTTDLTNTL